ncbi:MAG: hypothetical protein DRR16_26555 [Candidatus Parabeggiatoa sp. nov. 3]|nr:MAG: hypothetical protein DRR00_25600 [Gammaproteobacteria bacterium]RKZ60287.1 MAG: hypothetical protein DRQ99_22310 [Gammaproteobacteria bacterium]RKZ79009.1 MAG: hypothetical protein DRR16_26555 [Gammaproteobacteria bacterium]HEW98215.1 hypothetical protein [Beggiatoa sp.]
MPDKQLDMIKDNRTGCYSLLISYPLKDYLDLVKSAYENKGGLEKQRTALKTSTAKRIRERMVSDLKAGTILPPVVLGIVLSETQVKQLAQLSYFMTFISNAKESLTIIDGMQRTTAMNEVVRLLSSDSEQKDKYLNETQVRVEYWIAQSINSLIYRMLVLNTGQVPWNLKRQIEVVFNPIITEIKNSNPSLTLLEIDDSKSRHKAGQYQTDKLIELFLAFGLRKEKIKLQEQLADEFSRLDFIEATSNPSFTEYFKTILSYFVRLDRAFDEYHPQEQIEGRFKKGREIFDSQPARVGFIAACAREIMGKPGLERSTAEKEERFSQLSDKIDAFLESLEKRDQQALETFFDLNTLNEVISSRKTGSLGDYERAFFLKAFETLIEEKFKVPSLTVCWRAY